MKKMLSRDRRPFLVLAIVVAGMALADLGAGRIMSATTAFSVLQSFSTFGLVALGLALTMVIGEFDLSVAGLFGLGGCIAVIYGNDNALIGIAAALSVAVVFGFVQGMIIIRLRLSSVAVTLGGLLTASGLAHVLTMNRTITFDNIMLALALNEPIGTIFSYRSLTALAIFALAALVFGLTRIGRDLIATGSDRRAAMTAGVRVDRIVVSSFMISATLAALAGALLSYGLASASAGGLTDVLVPAIAASILGGVSLAGGVGSPVGLAVGVITLSALRSGLNALAVPPLFNDIISGLILCSVAIADAPYLYMRLQQLRTLFPYRA